MFNSNLLPEVFLAVMAIVLIFWPSSKNQVAVSGSAEPTAFGIGEEGIPKESQSEEGKEEGARPISPRGVGRDLGRSGSGAEATAYSGAYGTFSLGRVLVPGVASITILTLIIGILLILTEESLWNQLIKGATLISGVLLIMAVGRSLKGLALEIYPLILLCIVGLMLLTSSIDLISIYLSLELASLSLYILVAIDRKGQYSTEAGLKYFVLGALSTGILLMGSVLIYYETGETNIQAIALIAKEDTLIGAFFIITAVLFKLAAAPFHMWAPDVYEGAPTFITAFLAIVPKIAVIGLLIKLLAGPFNLHYPALSYTLLLPAVLSVVVGAFGALNQSKIKRLLAYSAIGHMGFLLIGLCSNLEGVIASVTYFFIYVIMSLNTFSLLLSINYEDPYISQLSGISRINPVFGMTFALALFSLAGIPPLAGFYSKLLIINVALGNLTPFIPLFVICLSVVACFFYLRIIKWIFFKDSKDYILKTIGTALDTKIEIPTGRSIVMGATLYITMTLMFYPEPFLKILSFPIISSLA